MATPGASSKLRYAPEAHIAGRDAVEAPPAHRRDKPAGLPTVLRGSAPDLRREARAERSHAGVSDLETDVGHRHLSRRQQPFRGVHPQPRDKSVRRFAEDSRKHALEVKRG